MRKSSIWWLLALLTITVLNGCFVLNQRRLLAYEKTFLIMDTVVSVQFYTDSEQKAQQIFDQVLAKMEELEQALSVHLPDSDVAKLAAAAGIEPVRVSRATLEVLGTAQDYAARTDGAFDITIAPILETYNFHPGRERRPSRVQLNQALLLVDWQKVELDPKAQTAFLTKPGMKIDLGGVAKGYIVDRCLEVLRDNGLEFGLANAGGDIGLLEGKVDGSPWRVGIKNPENPQSNFAIVEVGHGAIATSGDYERFFIEDGQRYHHILDPRTGMPADRARSVTVIAPSVQEADLLSTAVFVMGPERGMALVEALPDVEAVIWDREGKVHWSSGLLKLAKTDSVDYYFRMP